MACLTFRWFQWQSAWHCTETGLPIFLRSISCVWLFVCLVATSERTTVVCAVCRALIFLAWSQNAHGGQTSRSYLLKIGSTQKWKITWMWTYLLTVSCKQHCWLCWFLLGWLSSLQWLSGCLNQIESGWIDHSPHVKWLNVSRKSVLKKHHVFGTCKLCQFFPGTCIWHMDFIAGHSPLTNHWVFWIWPCVWSVCCLMQLKMLDWNTCQCTTGRSGKTGWLTDILSRVHLLFRVSRKNVLFFRESRELINSFARHAKEHAKECY